MQRELTGMDGSPASRRVVVVSETHPIVLVLHAPSPTSDVGMSTSVAVVSETHPKVPIAICSLPRLCSDMEMDRRSVSLLCAKPMQRGLT